MNAHSNNLAEAVAPLGYQAEVVRGQVCDDLNRRFWRSRSRLANAIEGLKDQVQRDAEKLPPSEFLDKYRKWRFM